MNDPRTGELAALPLLQDLVICREVSSHDRRGGNDNGFSNKAEFVRRERGMRVCIADIAGPGSLQSAWFGWPNHPQQPWFVEALWKRILGQIRFYFGTETTARLARPLGELMRSPPFIAPLAFDADRSGGGVISYVPMPFDDGLRISVDGGKLPMFFFHLWYHTYPHGTEVSSWTGQEDLGRLIAAWSPSTADLPAAAQISTSNPVTLQAGEKREIWSSSSGGTIRCLRMRTPENDETLQSVRLQAYWNDEEQPSIDLPLSLLFALENRWASEPHGYVDNADMNAVVLGIDSAGRSYFCLPMPFVSAARLQLENRSSMPLTIDEIVVEHEFGTPEGDIGFLRCEFRDQSNLVPNCDVVLAEPSGRGKIVGLVLSVRDASETFLEGDERISTDGCRSPHIMGDATETYFNGGWYFYERAFSCSLHGAPTFRMTRRSPGARSAVTMYRFHVTDWVPYRSGARFTIQHGPFNDVEGRYRSAVWYYGVAERSLTITDCFRPFDRTDCQAHRAAGASPARVWTRSGFFEGENNGQELGSHPRYAGVHPMLAVLRKTTRGMFHDPPADSPAKQTFTVCEHREAHELTVTVDPHHHAILLRRLFDQSIADQRARIEVDGEVAGVWFNAGGNRWKIWCEDDLILDPRRTRGKEQLRLRIVPLSPSFTASEYTVFSLRLPPTMQYPRS